MKRFAAAALFVAMLGLAGIAQAQSSPNPTGAWKWTTEFNGNSRESTLTLAMADGKITGTLAGMGRGGNVMSTPISDVTYANGEITFKVVREFNGNTVTTSYKGTISGDTITGQVIGGFRGQQGGGEPQPREWSAKRSQP